MKRSNTFSRLRTVSCGLALTLAALGTTGCQVGVGGQTLPSATYLTDDVQYFAPGSEFQLPREAAAMQAYRTEQDLEGR